MIREAIGIGETEAEAFEAACRELGVETYEAELEIIEQPSKKKFGLFGGTPAKVRAFISVTPVDGAVSYLKGILKFLSDSPVSVDVKEIEDGAVLNLSGENMGAFVGRRGETLDALQYLTGLVANNLNKSYYRITLDTGSYREKREAALETLGRKLALKAVKTGYKTSLEPMNPYERRLIHTAVQKINGAASWSEGEGSRRHVVVGVDPKSGIKPRQGGFNKNDRDRRGGGFNKRPAGNGTGRTGYQKSPDRQPKNEGVDFSLYGKIEPKNK